MAGRLGPASTFVVVAAYPLSGSAGESITLKLLVDEESGFRCCFCTSGVWGLAPAYCLSVLILIIVECGFPARPKQL